MVQMDTGEKYEINYAKLNVNLFTEDEAASILVMIMYDDQQTKTKHAMEIMSFFKAFTIKYPERVKSLANNIIEQEFTNA